MILPRDFYTRSDVVLIARELLGKRLVTEFNGIMTSGIITETEAYAGVTDKASHAYGGRQTERTGIMYREGGTAYVYLCYGIHSLFNVVTNLPGIPHAVLIRGIKPEEGIQMMQNRTGKTGITLKSGNGPGKVAKLLGIHYSHSGIDMVDKEMRKPAIFIENTEIQILPSSIIKSSRIGVDYAGEDALLPYRFLYNPE